MRRVTSVTTILLVASLLSIVACDRQPVQVKTVFTVEGMHCDACSSSIVASLERVEGMEAVTADHEKGKAVAVYRLREVESEELKIEIEKLGYTVTGMDTKPLES
jgi:copper chaperone